MANWNKHKADCRSPYIKETWRPAWDGEGGQPTFIGSEGPDMAAFGGTQYMWGNMPALDVLNLKQNEGLDGTRDFSLLFAGKNGTSFPRSCTPE